MHELRICIVNCRLRALYDSEQSRVPVEKARAAEGRRRVIVAEDVAVLIWVSVFVYMLCVGLM